MTRLPVTMVVLSFAAAGSVVAGTPLGLSCLGCHQAATNSAEMPALDAMPSARIAAALRAARDAPQTGSIMARFAVHLTDAQIESLALELGRKTR